MPDYIATYINEKMPHDAVEAAVLADDYILTHKTAYREDRSGRHYGNFAENRLASRKFEPTFSSKFEKNGRGKPDRDLVCNYCFNIGHWKNKCPVLATKLKSSQKKSNANVSPVLMTETTKVNDFHHSASMNENTVCRSKTENHFAPFITEGFVSLTKSKEKVPVKILRDTGSSESFIFQSVLPFSDVTSEGRDVLIKGIGLNTLSVPLHRVNLTSDLVCGEVTLVHHCQWMGSW